MLPWWTLKEQFTIQLLSTLLLVDGELSQVSLSAQSLEVHIAAEFTLMTPVDGDLF